MFGAVSKKNALFQFLLLILFLAASVSSLKCFSGRVRTKSDSVESAECQFPDEICKISFLNTSSHIEYNLSCSSLKNCAAEKSINQKYFQCKRSTILSSSKNSCCCREENCNYPMFGKKKIKKVTVIINEYTEKFSSDKALYFATISLAIFILFDLLSFIFLLIIRHVLSENNCLFKS